LGKQIALAWVEGDRGGHGSSLSSSGLKVFVGSVVGMVLGGEGEDRETEA
jgi:hypothetical protein